MARRLRDGRHGTWSTTGTTPENRPTQPFIGPDRSGVVRVFSGVHVGRMNTDQGTQATPSRQELLLGLVAVCAGLIVVASSAHWVQAVGLSVLGVVTAISLTRVSAGRPGDPPVIWLVLGLSILTITACAVLHVAVPETDALATLLCIIGMSGAIVVLLALSLRGPRADRIDTILDTLILAAGAGLLLWSISTTWSPVPIGEWDVPHTVLPVLGLVATGIAAHLMMSVDRRFWGLSAGLLLITTGNTIHAAETSGMATDLIVHPVVSASWVLGALLIVIAGALLRRPLGRGAAQGLGPVGTVIALGPVFVIGPLVLILAANGIVPSSLSAVAWMSLLIGVLVVFRLARAGEQLNSALERSQRAEQVQDLAMQSASMASWEWRGEGNEFVRSPGMASLYGLPVDTPEAELTELIAKATVEEDKYLAPVWMERIFSTPGPHEATYSILTPSGERRRLKETATSIADSTGKVVLVRGITQDITETERQAEVERSAQERLVALTENLPVAVFIRPVDPTRVPRYGNAAIERVFGMPWEQWARTWETRIHPEDQERVLAAADRLWEDGAIFLQQYRELNGAGEYLWVKDTGVLVRNAQGEPDFWLTTKIDVTDEVELLRSLEQAERRLRDLVEGLPLATYLTGPKDLANPSWFSPQVTELTGYTVEEALGLESFFLKVLDDGDRDRVRAAAKRSEETLRPFRTTYRMHRKDGRVIWVRDEATVLRDGAGNPVSWQGYMQDVTAQVAATERLREARDAAEEANRAKGVFLSTISHELRTPLNGIIGYAHLLLDGYSGELSEQQQADVQQIAKSGDHLLALIGELLDLSRIDSGEVQLATSVIDMPPVIEEAMRLTQPLAAQVGLTLSASVADGLPPVLGDAMRVQQILVNLIGNAIKFTPNGTVKVTAERHDEQVVIQVTDTGIGIAAEHLGSIFEPFRQVDSAPTRKHGGSGLGLPISRRLARLMGGDVTVTSTVGTGSTFTLSLPAALLDDD